LLTTCRFAGVGKRRMPDTDCPDHGLAIAE